MDHNEATADVFSEINSEREQDRIEKQYTEDYFQVDEGYFKNKQCLDIGCGAQPNGAKRLLEMGAKGVTCVDIDEEIKSVGRDFLGELSDDVTFVVDDARDFARECTTSFDHIHAAGSIHHMESKKVAFETIRNLSECTANSLYMSLNGSGGLMREFNSALREKYKTDPDFEQFIDQLEAEDLIELFEYIGSNLDGDCPSQLFLYYLKNEVDDDLVLSIKDRICAPTYLRFSEEHLRDFLREECGFTFVRRLEYYPGMNNIRKLLAPLYSEYDHQYARLLYGDGFIQLWCEK